MERRRYAARAGCRSDPQRGCAVVRLWPGLALSLVLVLGCAGTSAADSRPFQLRSAQVRVVDGVYLLDAFAHLRLTEPVREALHRGVELPVTWRIEIVRESDWWLDAQVTSLSQRYRLEYHELSLQYLVTNLNTDERRSFASLEGALGYMGRLFGYPLVDRMLLEGPARYSGRAQVRLDHGALPWPLRPTVWFSTGWELASEWRGWSFE